MPPIRHTMNEIFHAKYNTYIENNPLSDIWKTIEELSSITGFCIDDTTLIVYKSKYFLKNSKGLFTSVSKYESKTKFLKKMCDLLDGRIK